MSFDYGTSGMVAPIPLAVHAARLCHEDVVAPLSILDPTETCNLGEIKSDRISSLCHYSDESMLVRVTGIVGAGAGVIGPSLDILAGGWIVHIPEYHWEAAALLAVGNTWYMGSLLFG